jgi:hypothetical protein
MDWCACIGGTVTKPQSNEIGCTPPAGGGSAGGGAGLGALPWDKQLALEAFRQGSSMMMEALGEIFAKPSQSGNAALLDQQRRWEEEERRLAEEKRLNDERYARLNVMLKGADGGRLVLKTDSTSDLRLKGGSAPFGIPANPDGAVMAGGLPLKDFGGGERREYTAAEQLNSAAFLSRHARDAKDPETAKALADAAFETVVGGRVDLKIPDDVRGGPAAPADQEAMSRLRTEHQAAQEAVRLAQIRLEEALYKKQLMEQVKRDSRRKIDASKAKLAGLPARKEKERRAEEENIAAAEALLREAAANEGTLAREVAGLESGLAASQKALQRSEANARSFAGRLGSAP